MKAEINLSLRPSVALATVRAAIGRDNDHVEVYTSREG